MPRKGRRNAERDPPYRDQSTGSIYVSVSDASEMLGVTVSGLANRGDLRRGPEGGLHLGDLLEYSARRALDRARRKKTAEADDKDAAIVRKIAAQAEKAELEVEILRRSLVPVEDVYRDLSRLVSAAQARITQVPSKVAPQLEGLDRATIQTRLERAMTDLLQDLASYRHHDHEEDDDE